MKKLSYIFIVVMILSSVTLSFIQPKEAEALAPLAWAAWIAGSIAFAYFFPNVTATFTDTVIGGVLAVVMGMIYAAVTTIFRGIGFIFDYAIYLSVENFKVVVEKLGFIDSLWEFILNVANISFIFILLYIGISTILGITSTINKKTLTSVIIVAIVINFSLFFTQVVIDVSNLLAYQFYKSVLINPIKDEGPSQAYYGSPSSVFLEKTLMDRMFDAQEENNAALEEGNEETYTEIFFTYLMGTIFACVGIFVFSAGTILFIRRTLMLLFYMISSPIAFLGYTLPQLNSFKEKWKKGFIANAFVAPVFLFCIYLVARITTSDASEGGNPILTAISGDGDPGTFADALNGKAPLIIINYIVVTALFYGSYKVTQRMSADAVAGTGDFGKWIQGKSKSFMGRNTYGRAGVMADKALGNTMFGNSRYGTKLRDISTKKLANSQFGGTGESRVALDNRVKAEKEKARIAQQTLGKKNEFRSTLSDLRSVNNRIEDINRRERQGIQVTEEESQAALRQRKEITSTLPSSVRRLGIREIEELSESDLTQIYDMFSEGQRELIQKSEKIPEATREKLKESRTQGLITAVSVAEKARADAESRNEELGDDRKKELNKAIQDEMKKLSEKEKLSLPPSTIQTLSFVDAISQKEIDLYNDKSDYTPEVKKYLGDNRFRVFNSGKADEIKNKVESMSAEDIAKLDKDFLTKPEVLEIISPRVLEKLAGKASEKTINDIAEFILNKGPEHPSYEYITTGPGKIYWTGNRRGNNSQQINPNLQRGGLNPGRANNPPRRRT